MSVEAAIIDGYVDEPACLGVPPFISPYVRTIAGVFSEHGLRYHYLTIDQLRKDPGLTAHLTEARYVVMVAGTTVPGAYLGGKPATLTDIRQIGHLLRRTKSALCGPVTFGSARGGGTRAIPLENTGFSDILKGPPAEAVDAWLRSDDTPVSHDYAREDRWSVLGSAVIKTHPSYPHLMIELETARGCARAVSGGCSFCTEPLYGPPVYRSIPGIASEVQALYRHGARHFRLGRQPDLLAFGSEGGEFPRPDPGVLSDLFSEIRHAAPELRTLHIDNVNPGTIARHEEAAREALHAIIEGHTPGDVAAFGMETADPAVISANNLKASPEEVFHAIGVVNEEGAGRTHGIPELLPGLNFVCGLSGETAETYRKNQEFLEKVALSGFLVRRVNIRQLMPFPGTRAYLENTLKKHEKRFSIFKSWVRDRFDRPMLEKVFPGGTVLRQVVIEEEAPLSLGRPLGSYPILVGFPLQILEKSVCDALVVGYGSRSVTGLPYPLPVNTLPLGALSWVPGLNTRTTGLIVSGRPFFNRTDLEKAGVFLPPGLEVSFSNPGLRSPSVR